VLLGVTNPARRKWAASRTPELINNPEAFAKFQAAKANCRRPLRLLVVTRTIRS